MYGIPTWVDVLTGDCHQRTRNKYDDLGTPRHLVSPCIQQGSNRTIPVILGQLQVTDDQVGSESPVTHVQMTDMLLSGVPPPKRKGFTP